MHNFPQPLWLKVHAVQRNQKVRRNDALEEMGFCQPSFSLPLLGTDEVDGAATVVASYALVRPFRRHLLLAR